MPPYPPPTDAADPTLATIEGPRRILPIKVMKVGAASGLAMGMLYEYIKKPRDGSLGVVSWGDHPFAAPGDSGSLIWTVIGNRSIPLGVLIIAVYN